MARADAPGVLPRGAEPALAGVSLARHRKTVLSPRRPGPQAPGTARTAHAAASRPRGGASRAPALVSAGSPVDMVERSRRAPSRIAAPAFAGEDRCSRGKTTSSSPGWGRQTPLGRMMRRYWLPALLAREIAEPDCAPVRVRLLGEDPWSPFATASGRVGLLEEFCAHRRVSLFLGRNEQSGLRCVYHGWKYDVEGRCVDMPTEPPESDFRSRIRLAAYPTVGAGRGDLGLARRGRAARFAALRVDRAQGRPAHRHPHLAGVQLAAGAGRRDRQHACLDPAHHADPRHRARRSRRL